MIVVHHLGISQSDRIVWLCEELGLEYELVRYDRDPATGLAPSAYRALHPAGTAPVITDGARILGESGAIIEYLIHRYGGDQLAVASDQPNYPDYIYWFHFANASMVLAAMMPMIAKMAGAKPEAAAGLSTRLDRNYAMIEDRLAHVPWLAGDAFTAADLIMTFPLTTMRLFSPYDLAPYPQIRGYLSRIGDRPAFRAAMAKADPDLVVPLS